MLRLQQQEDPVGYALPCLHVFLMHVLRTSAVFVRPVKKCSRKVQFRDQQCGGFRSRVPTKQRTLTAIFDERFLVSLSQKSRMAMKTFQRQVSGQKTDKRLKTRSQAQSHSFSITTPGGWMDGVLWLKRNALVELSFFAGIPHRHRPVSFSVPGAREARVRVDYRCMLAISVGHSHNLAFFAPFPKKHLETTYSSIKLWTRTRCHYTSWLRRGACKRTCGLRAFSRGGVNRG